ncbi:VOC family protein [Nocardioides sp.]|uniref:VOC family protein n=1 Tax=Nocardioides sp. TaxID=35761 RepID=UPI0035B39F59
MSVEPTLDEGVVGLGVPLTFHHVCFVVDDVEHAEAYLTKFGIGPWRDYPPLDEYIELDVPDREAFLQHIYRVADLGDIQIQLCQPAQRPSPQRTFLEDRGPGVFQVGFAVPDVDRAQASAAVQGFDHVLAGRRADGSGFVYLDTLAALGTHLVARQTPGDHH